MFATNLVLWKNNLAGGSATGIPDRVIHDTDSSYDLWQKKII